MTKKNKKAEQDGFENVESALSKTEQYIEDNQKSLTIIVALIVVIVGGYLAYQKLYVKPIEKEAQGQMFVAEQYFEKDSFNLALNGDGNYFGFLDIIDEYGVSNAANLAHYYTGICYLHLGDYESAIEYLTGFDSNDKIISSIAYGAIGDAYVQMEEIKTAIPFYLKAAINNSDEFSAPIYLMKAAEANESLQKYGKALSLYEKIKEDYPKSNETRNIEKYISRVKMHMNK